LTATKGTVQAAAAFHRPASSRLRLAAINGTAKQISWKSNPTASCRPQASPYATLTIPPPAAPSSADGDDGDREQARLGYQQRLGRGK
jgi:hypothetical protein